MTADPRRAHASIVLTASSCTSCMLCVRECPTWCIDIRAHQEVLGDPGVRRPRVTNVLDQFSLDWGLCMFCGICIDVCPFEALAWSDLAPPISCEPGPSDLLG